MYSTGNNTFPEGSYAQIDSAAATLFGTPPDWALTASGGILTYTGSTRDFLVTVTASGAATSTDPGSTVLMAASHNDDTNASLIGFTTSTVAPADLSIRTTLSSQRRVTMASGDTLRAKFNALNAADTWTLYALSMSVVPE